MKTIFIQKNRGFVILFSVTVSGILLAIALGVLNVAFKEVRFSTSAKDANDAFFAADTGAECALKYDKFASSLNAFTGTATMNCGNSNRVVTPLTASSWSFIVSAIGTSGEACAKVSVTKSGNTTTVVSKGYNVGDSVCNSSNPNRVERELKTTYSTP